MLTKEETRYFRREMFRILKISRTLYWWRINNFTSLASRCFCNLFGAMACRCVWIPGPQEEHWQRGATSPGSVLCLMDSRCVYEESRSQSRVVFDVPTRMSWIARLLGRRIWPVIWKVSFCCILPSFFEQLLPGLLFFGGNRYEAEGRYRRRVKAQSLWFAVLESQVETGTPYMLYKDACNRKSNQQNLGTIKCSNLCTEVVEYSSPDEVNILFSWDQGSRKMNFIKDLVNSDCSLQLSISGT